MTWPGKNVIGSDMPSVRLGDALVSKRGTWSRNGDDGHPDVTIEFEVRDGRPECIEIVMRAKPGGRGLRNADLELLPLDQLAVQVFSQHAWPIINDELVVDYLAGDLPSDDPKRRGVEKSVREARYSRRGTITDAELREVADIYRQYVDSKPIQAIMTIIGKRRGWTERTAQRRVAMARDRGYLSPAEPGKKKA